MVTMEQVTCRSVRHSPLQTCFYKEGKESDNGRELKEGKACWK